MAARRPRSNSEMTGLVDIAAQMLAGMTEGWTQSIDRLGAFIIRVKG